MPLTGLQFLKLLAHLPADMEWPGASASVFDSWCQRVERVFTFNVAEVLSSIRLLGDRAAAARAFAEAPIHPIVQPRLTPDACVEGRRLP